MLSIPGAGLGKEMSTAGMDGLVPAAPLVATDRDPVAPWQSEVLSDRVGLSHPVCHFWWWM